MAAGLCLVFFQNFSLVTRYPVADFPNFSYLNRGQQLALISLQGLANRQGPTIYLRHIDETNWIAERVYQKNVNFKNRRLYNDVEAMIRDYRSAAGLRGAVVWDPARPFTLNVATNLSGVENLLMITPDLVSMASRLGLPVRYDLRSMFRESADERMNIDNATRWTYNALYGRQSRQWLGLLYYQSSHDGERDFMIQNKIHVMWLPSPGKTACKASPDPEYSQSLQAMIQYILQHAPANTPVLGTWQAHSDSGEWRGFCEYDGVRLGGQFGKYTIPTDFANNYSFHSKISAAVSFKQKLVRAKTPRVYDSKKKYVALVMQESGDSPGYYQTHFRYSKWDDSARGQVPISYGISPTLPRLMPGLVEYLYATATASDYFYSSVSGLGYMYPFPLSGGYTGYGQYGVMAEGTAKIIADQPKIATQYFKMSAQAMSAMDMDMLGIYSSAWTAWNPAWDGYLKTYVLTQMPGKTAIVADMGREEGMAPKASVASLTPDVRIFHTLTRWHDDPKWILNPGVPGEQAYDAAAANWLVSEIKKNSGDARFIQAMALSWQYNPRRLRIVQKALEPLGYEFVTLNEFDDLYRQSQGPKATASGIWNNDKSGAYAPVKAVDGDVSSRWASNNNGAATWLRLEYPEMKFVTAATIRWEAAGSFKLEVSLDGVTWARVASGTATMNSTSKLSLTNNEYGGWWARYVRLSPLKATDPQYRSVYEVQLTVK